MRWVVGLLLVLAAVLKSAQLVTEPTSVFVYGRFLAPLTIGIELGVGLLALTGIYWQKLRLLAVLLFTCFAAYSLSLAIGGAASCGCFGAIEVHPWWTFSLDVAVVAGLLFSFRGFGAAEAVSNLQGRENVSGLRLQQLVTGVVFAASVLSIAFLARLAGERTASADGFLTAAGGIVVLEPEKWVGKPFPIADSVDLDLRSGKWRVLLHRHDCPKCQEVLPKYEDLAAAGERIALVEVPPYGDSHDVSSACRTGKLSSRKEWFVQTPVEVQLRNGIVFRS